MPSLLMDVDSVQAAQSRMLQEIESMRAELTSLSSQVNQVVGSAWVGNAASDFQGSSMLPVISRELMRRCARRSFSNWRRLTSLPRRFRARSTSGRKLLPVWGRSHWSIYDLPTSVIRREIECYCVVI